MSQSASVVIEYAPDFSRREIRHVLMDWDGTISLGRSGWGGIMTEVYLGHLPALPGEDAQTRRDFAWGELMQLNGRPSIHQMERLAQLITARGGEPEDAAVYQEEFQNRLGEVLARRLDRARRDPVVQTTLLVSGVLDLLACLRARGIALTLASGTPLPQLRVEAELLGVTALFDAGIYGPSDVHDRQFSKRSVIHDLLEKYALPGSALMAFGDGPVELVETRAVGGLAIAVATDEEHPGSGRMDEWKRDTLLAHGAHAVIPDFQNAPALLAALLG